VTRRLLAAFCMACNREHGQPMCELCSALEDAEETASERREGSDDQSVSSR
jgi:hypothetical protein